VLGARLFRFRGVVLGAVGLLLALSARTEPWILAAGLPLLLLGLGVRAWAFAHLGPAGRTRDPAPPESRATSGPYRWLRHPVYVGNLAVAAGLLVVAWAPAGVSAGAAAAVLACYAVLAMRESVQLAPVPARSGVVLAGGKLVRSERSTWLSVGLLLGVMAIVSV